MGICPGKSPTNLGADLQQGGHWFQFVCNYLGSEVYKVTPPPREFNNSVWEEYQVVKRGKSRLRGGIKHKKAKGEAIFIISRLLGRVSSGEDGKGNKNFGRKNQEFKK